MGILRDSKTEPSPWRGDICGQGGGLSPSSRSSGSNQVPMAWAVTMMGGVTPKYLGLQASVQQVAGILILARADRPVAAPQKKTRDRLPSPA